MDAFVCPVRISTQIIEREIGREKKLGIDDVKLYAYQSLERQLYIHGQIVGEKITRKIRIIMILYDSDGDVIQNVESENWGAGIMVSSCVEPRAYFDGFPFSFVIYSAEVPRINRMVLRFVGV